MSSYIVHAMSSLIRHFRSSSLFGVRLLIECPYTALASPSCSYHSVAQRRQPVQHYPGSMLRLVHLTVCVCEVCVCVTKRYVWTYTARTLSPLSLTHTHTLSLTRFYWSRSPRQRPGTSSMLGHCLHHHTEWGLAPEHNAAITPHR